MNTSNIKKYAPQARNDFIAAMRKQAAKYGITADRTLPRAERRLVADWRSGFSAISHETT